MKVLGAQLVQMKMDLAKPSEKLQIVDILNNVATKRPATTAPPSTPAANFKIARCKTPGSTASKGAAHCKTPVTHANGASNLTDFSATLLIEVRVPSPTKKPGDNDSGFGFCCAGAFCGVQALALDEGCFDPSGNGKLKHACNRCNGIVHSPALCGSGGEGDDLVCKPCDQ